MSKFFSKFKGEKEDHSHLNSESSSSSFASNNPYQHTQAQPPAYQPPPGPPPSQQTSTQDDNPPPYHDWTSIPDNSLLPPPPPLTSDYSSGTNASYDDAAAAHAWCAAHPVFTPKIAHVSVIAGVMQGRNGLAYPAGASERGWTLKQTEYSQGQANAFGATPSCIYQILSARANRGTRMQNNLGSSAYATPKAAGLARFRKPAPAPSSPQQGNVDQVWTSTLPMYFASTSSPLSPHFASPKPTPFTIYFEITLLKTYSADATVAIGYVSKPYPENRQPGWHRASVGVHSDDGNRYVNDSWGGRPFTDPFREGETIGLAVQFSPEQVVPTSKQGGRVLQSEREVRSTLPRCKTRVFVTRNGNVTGSWEMDEERDAERDEGVAGLMGEADLYGAVGTFGDVDVEVRFYAVGDGFVAPPV